MNVIDNISEGRDFMCMQCGMCTGGCPEAGISPFNIRKMIRERHLHRKIEQSLPWFCTSCGSCTLDCPRDVKPSEVVIEIRSNLVEEGRIPLQLQKALENTYLQKNPWGRPQSKRGAWLEDLDFEVPHVGETKSKRLLFTCCIQAYDPRCMIIPVNVARILNRAGMEFGILGKEEACCGNEIRRIGELGLFEELVEENSSLFKQQGVREIITLSPHCMNALKREYGDLDIKILHYTEVLASMIEDGSIEFKGSYSGKVIYHDPCFLGKQNNIFDEPRDILRSIKGLELLEFSESKRLSLCCEGGGGRMFYEAEILGERNSKKRVLEAIKKGAEILVTSCPFCLMNFEDPAAEEGLTIKELSEIVINLL